jgi:hypothetical protein
MLHKRYAQIRTLVDRRFVLYRRRCRAEGVEIERIELWHDLLEAGLAADRDFPAAGPAAAGPAWAEHVLAKVEERYQMIRNRSPKRTMG